MVLTLVIQIANPAFHRSMPVGLFGKLTQKVFTVIDQAESETIDFHQMAARFALDAIGLAGFGKKRTIFKGQRMMTALTKGDRF